MFFIEFDGPNLMRGLAWLVFADPIILTIAYWAFMLIGLPITLLVAGVVGLIDRTKPPA